jgi:hypothetical protein
MKSLIFILSLFVASTALAEPTAFQNEANTTKYSTAGTGGPIAMDSKGKAIITSGTGATDLGKAEDSAHTSGDVGVQALGVRNNNAAVFAGTELDYSSIAVNSKGAPRVDVDIAMQNSNANALLKPEDSAHVSGDAGVAAYAVRNDNRGNFIIGTNGDYGPFAVDAFGGVLLSATKQEDAAAANNDDLVGVAGVINNGTNSQAADGDYTHIGLTSRGGVLGAQIYDDNVAGGRNVAAAEDLALGADVAGFKVFGQTQDPLSVDQGTTGDAAFIKLDRAGRTITTLAPAGESWQACTGNISTATNTTLKAAVASNRHYVTHFSCAGRSSAGNFVYLNDGTGGTAMYAQNMVSNAVGIGFHATFPVPLRGTSNTLLSVQTLDASGITCCASGYISVN